MGITKNERCFHHCYDLKYYIESLGDEGKNKFIEWIKSINRREYRSNALNYELGISYANDVWRAGQHLVYLYTDEKGIPFYVGKGNEFRATQITGRSEAFKDKLSKCETCRIFAVAFDVMEEDALNIETLVINELLNRGWRLCNSQKVSISKEKVNVLRENYSEIVDVLNEITGRAIDYLLDERDVFGDKGRVYAANRTTVKPLESIG